MIRDVLSSATRSAEYMLQIAASTDSSSEVKSDPIQPATQLAFSSGRFLLTLDQIPTAENDGLASGSSFRQDIFFQHLLFAIDE